MRNKTKTLLNELNVHITVFELNNLCFCDCFELASKVTRSNHSYKLQVKMGKL